MKMKTKMDSELIFSETDLLVVHAVRSRREDSAYPTTGGESTLPLKP